MADLHFYTTNDIDRFPRPSTYASRKHSWIHIFPEGKIQQHPSKTMRYFKWGVARLILEADTCPDVVPMWIEGNDSIMSEERTWPRWLPRVGKSKNVGVWFGENVGGEGPSGIFLNVRSRWRELVNRRRQEQRKRLDTRDTSRTSSSSSSSITDPGKAEQPQRTAPTPESHAGNSMEGDNDIDNSQSTQLGVLTDAELMYGDEARALREECTMLVRQEVLRVRRLRGLPDEDPKQGLVETRRLEGSQGQREGRMADGSLVKDT